MTSDEIVWLDIEGIRSGIEAGRLTAREVADAFLARIHRLDPELQAFSAVYDAQARASADRLDAEQAAGEPLRPLHGVAVALKDLCDVAGEPTRAGTLALGESPAASHAEVVDRLTSAGALILGKVKMTEGAFVEHHPSITPPVNPWHTGRWTGISSSGSGVAVAAGLCTFALGTDTGGSIRYPSAACGLSGLKPTHGRISIRGVQPLAASLDHIGPMARSVADASAAFDVLVGVDPEDPWSRSAPAPGLPRNLKGARIGFDRSFAEEGVAPRVVEVLHDVLSVLRDAGAEIVDVRLPPVDEAIRSWLAVAAPEIARAHAATYPERQSDYGPALAAVIELGRAIAGQDVAEAWKVRVSWTRRLARAFENAGRPLDALLAPVIPGAFPANANLGQPDALPNGAAATRFTGPFNFSGSPSLTLCGGFDDEGAPIGFQLVGAIASEKTLLSLGAAYQSRTDHHRRRPTL